MFEDYVNKLNTLQDLDKELNDQMRALFMGNIILTWRWWLCVAMTVIPWAVWIIFRKRRSTARLLFSGFIVIIISTLLDNIGVNFGLWDYNVDVDSFIPCFIMWDITLLPVTIMTFLQYRPTINPVIKAVIFAGLASFVAEPIFAWMNFYNPGNWKHIYSFPIFIIIYLIAQLCLTRKSFEML